MEPNNPIFKLYSTSYVNDEAVKYNFLLKTIYMDLSIQLLIYST